MLNNVTAFISKVGLAIGQDMIEEPTTEKWMTDILNPIREIVLSLLWPILFVLSVAGIIYVVTLGIQYAKRKRPISEMPLNRVW